MENSHSGKPNIVIVGHVVIDRNKTEQTSYVRWGSPAMFMKRYFRSSAAINPTIVASYGEDFLEFASETNLLPKKPNLEHSIVYENIMANGHRTQYCHGDNHVLPELTLGVVEAVAGADLLFLAPLTPAFTAEYVSKLMQHVSPNCLKTLLPQGYLRTIAGDGLVSPREFVEAADILPHFDLLIISDEDHPLADKISHEWKHASPKTNIIVTKNKNGADIILENNVQYVPTEPIAADRIVDSVGLGDVFGAATAFQLQRSGDIIESVNAGHVAAREKLLSPVVR